MTSDDPVPFLPAADASISGHASTAAFRGDLLAVGLQGGTQGVQFWDVTDPYHPHFLSLLPTFGVHELCLFQRGGQVLALLATHGAGVHSVDATDPTRPRILAVWRLQDRLRIDPAFGSWPASFDHSVSVSADGTLAYVSYWDAGVVILDIAHPADPVFVGRAVYPPGEEGNTHSAAEAEGGRLLVTTDEDFDPEPTANAIRVTSPPRWAGLYPATELGFTWPLGRMGPVQGEVVYVGSGLPGTAFVADPRGKIALIDPGNGPQELWDQVRHAQEAGAAAVLLSRLWSHGGSPGLAIPGTSLPAETGQALKAALAAGEKVAVELRAGPATWGFVRLWDIRDRAHPVQVGSFATPNTLQYPPEQPAAYTAHNPAVRGNRLYVAWYADGVRVVALSDSARPREIGHFMPPFIPGTALPADWGPWGLLGDHPVVLGVVEHRGLILLSDIQSGLWILHDLPD